MLSSLWKNVALTDYHGFLVHLEQSALIIQLIDIIGNYLQSKVSVAHIISFVNA